MRRRQVDPWGPEAFAAYAQERNHSDHKPHWGEVGHHHPVEHMPTPKPENGTFWRGDGWWVGPLVIAAFTGLGLWMLSIIGAEVFNILTFVCIVIVAPWWTGGVIGRVFQKLRRRDRYYFFPRNSKGKWYVSMYYVMAPFAIWGLIALMIWIGNI